jgi:2-oxoglutarate dehydrogenase E2 component (dihydrolipoamide succinyltransferase)
VFLYTNESATSWDFSSAIRKVPAVIETPEGDFIGIRQNVPHSYDHRCRWSAGGGFVKRVAEYDVNRDL